MNKLLKKLKDAGFQVYVEGDFFSVTSTKTNAVVLPKATYKDLEAFERGIAYVGKLPENRGNEYKKREFRAVTSSTVANWNERT